MTRRTATSIGFIAVLLWALLALFTIGTAPVPPFQLNAMTFAVGGTIGLGWVTATNGWPRLRTVPLHVYILGTIGLFGYHALYFSALRLAPPAEASLIAYLWPLFIVLFSGLLPGERLGLLHILGALIAFAGAALLIAPDANGFTGGAGLILAGLCALTWSGYSVLSRSFGAVPTDSVAVFCILTALLSVPLHLMLEQTQWPADALGWSAVLALGLGPVGLAFYVWDVGVKAGDIQLLGVASYAAPLLSTLILVIVGVASASLTLLLAAALIAGGAGLAAYGSARAQRSAPR
ncbi:aromatic amino acid exporter YddG [Gymnodinialimonas hymeniacidonis]|uniref:aromatic amino acid exporter YddG n=1 Tax=Gymnodinialimonas hymeniacidonis TaxID=3126508 RepID=UPI0034C687D7